MMRPAKGLSLQELVAAAKAQGHPVTRAKVVRWHKAGLVPRPQRLWLGRGKGSRSLGYPPEALHHVLAVSWLLRLRVRRDLSWVAWVMWLAGYSVTDAVRRQLATMAARYEAELDQGVASLEAEDGEEPLSDIVRRLSIAPGLRAFGVRPNRYRGSKAGEFETALHLTLTTLTGRRLDAEKLDDDQLVAIEHAILGQRSRPAVLKDTLRRERRRLEKERHRPSDTGVSKLEIAQQQEARDWRSVLRAWLKGLNQEVGVGMVTSGIHFAENEDLERRREECIAVWLLVNRASLGGNVPLGPSLGLFLTWFVLRELSSVGEKAFQTAGDQAFRFLMSDEGSLLERIAVGTFRLALQHWGMPLPDRPELLAVLLPLTCEEHPDAHLICRPIETGKRRSRPDRVRAAALS